MRARTGVRPRHVVRVLPALVVAGFLVTGLFVDSVWWRSTTVLQWAPAIASAPLALYSGRFCLLVVLLQVALLLVVDTTGGAGSEVVQLALLINLFALTERRGRELIVGTVGATIATVLNLIDVPFGQAPPPLGPVGACVVAAPVLLGLHQRALRDAAAQAEQRVQETMLRAELERRQAASSERAAISRELHDLVAHHVASIVLRVGVARHVAADTDPRIRAVLDDVHTTATTALEDLRRLVSVLRDPERGPVAPLPDPAELIESLNDLVRRTRQAGLTVSAEFGPGLSTLDSVRRLAVLRIAQEALTNAIKHAGRDAAARLKVSLVPTRAVVIEVADNGGRADTSGLQVPGGHGLVGMRERVELLGGSLHAGPAVGGGWRLTAVLPENSGPEISGLGNSGEEHG
ncbi:sensor histidine kinase [Allokutzneria sp. A3M-2-11 16]|uniref:sensor histidine kinase n=1 Tax=Allokutzneria sp. A3M-2-11 16 TaxID=2962043 RepID=UPI0020B809DD|nr:sensor histidine kinase [Allokutzneria sp. A3M-2-11 16]MCP3802700.1 sensor histidine kinase [Allokutzneria sp. A3M-2-11 16]